jgi:glycosyltransferase involved in cell wall biosynthesis
METPRPQLVSVIVPVWNAAAYLPEQLEALGRQSYAGAWELIIVDNGSTDSSRDIALSFRDTIPQLRVVDAPDKPNSFYARNVGLHVAEGDLLTFCDADDIASIHWLSSLAAAAMDWDLVGGAIHPFSDVEEIARARGDDAAVVKELPVGLGFLPFSPSANLAIWRRVFDAVGYWDEDFASAGDVEFCWRAQLQSHSFGFAPDAVIHYRYRNSTLATAKQWFAYAESQPKLYAHYRDAGMSRRSTRLAIRTWMAALARSPKLIWSGQVWRIQWVLNASVLLGKLTGSIKNRILYL